MKTQKLKIHVLMVSEKFPVHHKKKGQPTNFQDYILAKVKIHTIRSNYELWKKRVDEVNAGVAILSVRQWTGLPYRSKQIEIAQFNNSSGIGVQKLLKMEFNPDRFVLLCNDDEGLVNHHYRRLATNDGLKVEDFKEWFKTPVSEPMAIIHFTDYRY